MAAIQRWDLNAGVLQTWLNRKTLENFEPNLQFYKMGTKPLYQQGYDTIAWAKFSQLNVTPATATLTDGVTPSDTAFNASVITTTPTQYGIVVNLSDMVIKNNVIDFISGSATEVGMNMARIVDEVIQTEVMAGTNVRYADGVANRAGIGASNVFEADEINKAQTQLKNQNAPAFEGNMYVAIAHPNVIFDLRADTAAGSWLEANKYVTNDKIFKGEVGSLNGVRFVESTNVKTFASTVTVYPTLFLGRGAYGISECQTLQTYITPKVASDSDPLAQRQKIGAKIAFSAKRLQEDAMVRVESATSFA